MKKNKVILSFVFTTMILNSHGAQAGLFDKIKSQCATKLNKLGINPFRKPEEAEQWKLYDAWTKHLEQDPKFAEPLKGFNEPSQLFNFVAEKANEIHPQDRDLLLSQIFESTEKVKSVSPEMVRLVWSLTYHQTALTPSLVQGYLVLAQAGQLDSTRGSVLLQIMTVDRSPLTRDLHRQFAAQIFETLRNKNLLNTAEALKALEDGQNIFDYKLSGEFRDALRVSQMQTQNSPDAKPQTWNERLGIQNVNHGEDHVVSQELFHAENQRIEAERAEAARIEAERIEQERLAAERKAQAVTKVTEIINVGDERASLTEEALKYKALSSMGKNGAFKKSVTLFLGNNVAEPTATETQNYKQLVSDLSKQGFTIFYDADTASSQVISEAAGNNGIGITGSKFNSVNHGQLYFISNPYMRMKLFENLGARKVMTQDSVTGHGLMIQNKINYIIGTTGEDSLKEWASSVSKKYKELKFKEYKAVKGYFEIPKLVEAIKSATTDGTSQVVPQYTNDQLFASLTESEVNELILYGKEYIETRDQIEKNQNGETIPGGAAMLGSRTALEGEGDIAYHVAYTQGTLGIGTTHGGSTGVMLQGGSGAFDSGAHSIGIPLSKNGAKVDGEKITASSRHSLTVPVSSYEVRIPMIIHRKQILEFAAGGPGTMGELGTVLVDMGSKKASDQRILAFVSQAGFYNEMVDWLKGGSLPSQVTDRIWSITNASQVHDMVAKLESHSSYKKGELKQAQPVVKRNSNTGFVPLEDSKSGKNDDEN